MLNMMKKSADNKQQPRQPKDTAKRLGWATALIVAALLIKGFAIAAAGFILIAGAGIIGLALNGKLKGRNQSK